MASVDVRDGSSRERLRAGAKTALIWQRGRGRSVAEAGRWSCAWCVMATGWSRRAIREGTAVLGSRRFGRLIGQVVACAGVVCGVGDGAHASIDVMFAPGAQTAGVGDAVRLGLIVRSDSDVDQLLSVAQVIVRWDPVVLRLVGQDRAGAVPLLASAFPSPDPYGLNESNPPQDGMGLYVAFAPLGNPTAATPAGTLLTTLVFEAIALGGTQVEMVTSAGMPEGRTSVLDGLVPNRDVTGRLFGGEVVVAVSPGSGAAVLCAPAWAWRRRRRAWNGEQRTLGFGG